MESPFPLRCRALYTARRMLASGAFGSVYLAEQVALSRMAAVKLLHGAGEERASAFERFLNEARIAASLSHPHIVSIFDHDVEDGVAWIAYEYVAGGAVDELVAEHGPLPWPEAARLGFQVASALAAAHARGVIHRDVKPPNVLVVAPGRYKLTDFGVAHWSDGPQGLTGTGNVIGTPAYLAPEQYLGQPARPQSDLYALGTMLFEVVTGERVYAGAKRDNIAQLHLRATPRVPSALDPTIPKGFDAVIARSLAKRPEDRYPSADAMGAALAELLSSCSGFDRPALSLEEPPRPAEPPRARRSPAPAGSAGTEALTPEPPVRAPRARRGAGVAVGVLAVALVLFALGGHGPRPPPPPTLDPAPPPSPTLDPTPPTRPPASTPPGMRAVPAGKFTMGDDQAPNCGPRRTVHVDLFYVDRFEVSNAEYDAFCARTHHALRRDYRKTEPDLDRPDCPVVGVTWQDARDYCADAGKELPTEAQWEKAARGTDGRRWPWGNAVQRGRAVVNIGFDGIGEDSMDPYIYSAPVTAFPEGESPCGARNMAGNVAEWCLDEWASAYDPGDLVNPRGRRTGDGHAIRGGCYRSAMGDVCTYSRDRGRDADPIIGFRGVFVPPPR